MISTNSKKVFALCSFVTLLTAFVSYKAGFFDDYIDTGSMYFQSSPNGGAINNIADTVPVSKKDIPSKDDTLRQASNDSTLQSGTGLSRILKDSLEGRPKPKLDSLITTRPIMSSSKSGPIFNRVDKRQNDLLRIFKLYQGDSAGLRKALERHFR
jgi:hypothetical protein